MAGSVRVGLEVGKTWTFATAVDWPGWCRRGRGEEAAIEALLEYQTRYAAVAGAPFGEVAGGDPDVDVVGRVPGNATTDFGAPGTEGPWDLEPLAADGLERLVSLLEACWVAFDGIVASAPEELRKGPRGGGRDRDGVGAHVREAERSYARKLGARVPPRTPWPEQRAALTAALRAGGATAWPAGYGIRRCAWHVLDHAWEIEDRST